MNLFKCSICGDDIEEHRIAFKWNQDLRAGWGLCIDCKNKYRDGEVEKKQAKIQQKDSYNYFTTTARQMLFRHGFLLNERTVGSLRNESFIKWSCKATAPNDYILKLNLEIEKKGIKEFIYNWDIKTYNPQEEFLKEVSSDKPNVPMLKDFLNDFFKVIGSNPYIYFRSTFKSVLSKHHIMISDSKENDDLSTYKGKFLRDYRWTAEIEKDCKWNVKLYKLKGRGASLEEHNGSSFAIPPLKEFFNRIAKKY